MRTENSYGVVVAYKQDTVWRFLLLHQTNNVWSFPKGHEESGEEPRTTALRELKEETGIFDIRIIDVDLIVQEYSFDQGGERINKVNRYFVGIVTGDGVTPQAEEVSEYRWATYDEAVILFREQGLLYGLTSYDSWKQVLTEAAAVLASNK